MSTQRERPPGRRRPTGASFDCDAILTAIDCVLLGRSAAYASAELTTGRRLYQLMLDRGCSNKEQLREQVSPETLRRLILEPNVRQGAEFAQRVRARLQAATPVVSPAPLEVPQWTQVEYRALWVELIRTRIDSLYFRKGWEYSTGCTLEFLVGIEEDLPCFDEEGERLDLTRGLSLIADAVQQIDSWGIQMEALTENFYQLRRLHP